MITAINLRLPLTCRSFCSDYANNNLAKWLIETNQSSSPELNRVHIEEADNPRHFFQLKYATNLPLN